jgi:hypothetical protein
VRLARAAGDGRRARRWLVLRVRNEEGYVAKGLSAAEINKLARIGAAAKLAELERDIVALRRAFPGLKPAASARGAGGEAAFEPKTKLTARVSKRGHRKPMSAAERKAVSERMKRYWEDKRKGKAKD